MSKEMLELADAGKRHAEGLTVQLDNRNWMPKRAHVEQARNSIAKLAAALRASAVAEPVAWRVDGIRQGKNQIWFYWKPEWPGMHEEQGDKVTPLYTHPAPAAPVPASVREALEKIAGHRECDPSDLEKASKYKREEGLWTVEEYLADVALASLPSPEAAPTREETIEQCAKVCNRWIKSMNVHESLAADDIAKAILALKAAPAK